jgi:hypothetical protein
MAVAGATGVFCLLAFWTKPDISGLINVFHRNLLVASVSLAVAIAIHVIFFPLAYIGIGVLVIRRTMNGGYEQWTRIGSARGGKMQRIALRLSGKELQLRVAQSVLELLETSPPSPGSAVEAKFGPLGILLQLKWRALRPHVYVLTNLAAYTCYLIALDANSLIASVDD